MPVFWQQILGVIVRTLMVAGASILAAHGGPHFTDNQVTNAVIVTLPVATAVAWGIYERYQSRLKFLTALANDPATEAAIEAIVKDRTVTNPPINTPKDVVPSVTPKP